MIQSIDRAARILDLLQGARKLGISELAAALDLPPSTVHGLVKSLQVHGLVAQEPTGNRYVLGPALLKLSSVYLDTLDVRSRAIRWMHELSRSSGAATRLGVNLRGDVLLIHHDRRPDGSEQMPETGLALPAHASALGKILLAYDEDMRDDVLGRHLADLTGDTNTDPGALADELREVRRNAHAVENEEALLGESSMAVPVTDEGGRVIAALSIVLPSEQFPPPRTVEGQLRDAARNISRDLGARSWPPR
ncbi:IclR family transcriptional regulator [Microbacterium sp. A196]|uniref:IclR family transcriptional regulator n=1 Tax=Microbacterium sp. A196 TaxID=3457320 RepID=UPI003FD5EFE5